MLWKEYRSTKSDLSDFYPIEQFELKLHQVLGEPVSTLCNPGINLRSLAIYESFLSHPTLYSWFINLGELRVDYCPILAFAWPSHISWQV